MNSFFAKIRKMLAREFEARLSPENSVLGEVVVHTIKEIFLPSLRKRLEEETDPRKREDMEIVIELWEKYGDRKNRLSTQWNEIAAYEVGNVFRLVDEADAEDAAQELAMRALRDDWIVKSKFDPMDGPERLKALWRIIVRNRAKHELETKFLNRPDRSRKSPSVTDEGYDLIQEQVSHYSELEDLIGRETREALSRFVHEKAGKSDLQREMFDMWQELAISEGASNVDRKNDIYPVLTEKYKVGPNRMQEHWREVRGYIMDFFKKEMDIVIPTRVEKRLFRGSLEGGGIADRVAVRWYRSVMAAWVLSPVLGYSRKAADDLKSQLHAVEWRRIVTPEERNAVRILRWGWIGMANLLARGYGVESGVSANTDLPIPISDQELDELNHNGIFVVKNTARAREILKKSGSF